MPTFKFYFETMAGTHLTDAVDALRDSSSADALYSSEVRQEAREGVLDWEDLSLARQEAEGLRFIHSRRALLFAAFAAEAYANDFLYDHWGPGQDLDALVKLSTVDKYAMLPGFAGVATSLDRGREPLQHVRRLFKRRDALVHAKPEGTTDLIWNEDEYNPGFVVKSIFAVAQSAEALVGTAPEASVLSHVLAERRALSRYGERPLPDPGDDPAATTLLAEARRRDWQD